MMIDAHAHLDHPRFDKDRHDLIRDLRANGIEYVINTGSNLQSSRQSIDMAHNYDEIYATVGIHPLDADEYQGPETLELLRNLAKEAKVVAIGEIGLDNHYDDCPSPSQQERAFEDQLELARDLGLPVVVHSREADEDTYRVLKAWKDENPDFSCLLHCYSYTADLMKDFVKMDGFYISLGGVTTFAKADQAKKVAKEVPLDRLLIETDCPYMAPTPYRGKRNEPKYVTIIGENIAKLRSISFDQVRDQTTKNAKRFYRIDD